MACRLMVVVVLLSSWVRADQAAPEVQAKLHFERGVALIAQRNWSDAIVELEAARAIYPTAPIHFNLGLAYRATGRATEAIAAFERYRRAVGDNAERQAEVARYLATLRASLAQLRLDVSPPHATVLVDKVPPAPGVLEVDPGTHTITATAEGHEPMSRTLTLAPGSTSVLQLHLVPVKSSARLQVNASNGEVRIDGIGHGRSPVNVEVEPGKHVVEVVAGGHLPERRELVLEPGEHKELTLSLKPERKIGKWVAVGVTLAVVVGSAVAIGVVLGVKDEPPLIPQLGVVYTGLKVTSW